jgi:hypothetical protein
MAKSARLPTPVIDFIQQHHGRRPIMFFLAQARERALREDRTLDESKFYYHGPSPQSRETGIIMLGDSCESATRANRPDSEEIIRDTVEKIFNENISLGELNNSGLTLGELKIIKESFIYTLKGMYHNRIRYPEAPDEIDEPAGTAPLVEKGNIN